MSYLEYKVQTVPTGARKILYANWALVLLLTAVASVDVDSGQWRIHRPPDPIAAAGSDGLAEWLSVPPALSSPV